MAKYEKHFNKTITAPCNKCGFVNKGKINKTLQFPYDIYFNCKGCGSTQQYVFKP